MNEVERQKSRDATRRYRARARGEDIPRRRPGFKARDLKQVVPNFWGQVYRTADCWLWTGAVSMPQGYGHFTWARGDYYAHRFSYELVHGRIPTGLHVDHLCGVRLCVNPGHLEAVTTREHTRRHRSTRTTCKNGHAWAPENLYVRPDTGRATCRLCAADRGRQRVRTQRDRARAAHEARVLRGTVIRPGACSRCGLSDRRIEAHHPDYSKPFEVVWLCSRCHGAEHASLAQLEVNWDAGYTREALRLIAVLGDPA